MPARDGKVGACALEVSIVQASRPIPGTWNGQPPSDIVVFWLCRCLAVVRLPPASDGPEDAANDLPTKRGTDGPSDRFRQGLAHALPPA